MATVNKPVKNDDGSWTYPSAKDVLEEVGLYTMKEYIEVRRQTITNYIVNRPIFALCTEAERKRGSMPRQFWWEQPMDLDAARKASASVVAAGEESAEDQAGT